MTEEISAEDRAKEEAFLASLEQHSPAAGKMIADFMETFPDEEKGPAMTALAVCVLGSVITSVTHSFQKQGVEKVEADNVAIQFTARLGATAAHIATYVPPTVH